MLRGISSRAASTVLDFSIFTIAATGGRFNFDVSDGLPDGYAQICEDAVVEGLACRYAVYPEEEANARQPHAALVLSADGSTTNSFRTFPPGD